MASGPVLAAEGLSAMKGALPVPTAGDDARPVFTFDRPRPAPGGTDTGGSARLFASGCARCRPSAPLSAGASTLSLGEASAGWPRSSTGLMALSGDQPDLRPWRELATGLAGPYRSAVGIMHCGGSFCRLTAAAPCRIRPLDDRHRRPSGRGLRRALDAGGWVREAVWRVPTCPGVPMVCRDPRILVRKDAPWGLGKRGCTLRKRTRFDRWTGFG